MNTKSTTTRPHFPRVCAALLWLCLIAAGPVLALDTETSTYGSVNIFTFDLYGVGDDPPAEFEDDFPGSLWNLSAGASRDIRRAGDLWAEILGPGSALATRSGHPLASGVPFVVVTTHDEDNASAVSLPNENDTMTGVQRALIDAVRPDRPGQIEIGLLFGSDIGLDFSPLSSDDALIGTVFHELGHALGVLSLAPLNRMDDRGEAVMERVSAWDTHLYDRHGTGLDVGLTLTPTDPGEAGTGLFYVGEGIDSGVTFRGDHVAEVLSDGRTRTASADYAFTVEGREGRFDLSHIELERSLMSHQMYRNYSTFLEAELAALQDIGHRIDRRNFYGFSVYADNAVLTWSGGYHGRDYDPASDTGRWTDAPNTATLGVGLHIYGKGNTVTVGQNDAGTGDVLAHGEAGTGLRVDGSGNTLIVGADARPLTVSADGKNGTGILAAYGKDHVIAIGSGATVAARGEGGIGARFDFGHNLVGDRLEYRGSHIHWKEGWDGDKKRLPVTGEDDSGLALNLDGPLVRDFTVAGALAGGTAANGGAALFISDNARVGTITIKGGATVTGDIISRWDAQNGDIQYSGDRADLYATLTLEQGATFDGDIDGASGVDLVNQGLRRSSDGGAVLNSAAVHNLDNRADLTIGQTLTTSGLARVSGSALTLRDGAKADFQGGLDLRNGGALDLDGAQVSVGRGAAVVYDAGSVLRVGAGLFKADAASFFTLNDDGATVTLADGADRLVGGQPGGALTLRLARPGDVYTLAQWADARNKLGLGGADLAIYGTLSDEVVLGMRTDASQARFTGADAPRAYGADGNPPVPYAPFNAVRLEDRSGAPLSPDALTIDDGEFALSHWVTDADAIALTVGGVADLWISGAASGHGIFESADGASGPRTSLSLTDAARVLLGAGASGGRAAMPLDRLNIDAGAALTLSGVNASASSVNASGTVKVQDSALAGNALTLDGGALTLDAGEVRTRNFTVVNGGTVNVNNGVLSATDSFAVTPAASFPPAGDAEGHIVDARNLAVRGRFSVNGQGVMEIGQGGFSADSLNLSGVAGRTESFLVSFNDVDAAVGRLSFDLEAGYGAMNFRGSRVALGSLDLGAGLLSFSGSSATADAFEAGGGILRLTSTLFGVKTVTGDINSEIELKFGALASLGMEPDKAAAAARAGGMIVPAGGDFGERAAALVLGAPVTLGPQGTLGILFPDEPPGDAPDFDPSVYFGKGSLLVVDTEALNGRAALTAADRETAAMTAKGATLRVLGATVKGVDILDNFGGGLALQGWEEVSTPDRMLSLTARLADADTVSVFADVLDPLQVFPGLGRSLSAPMREVWGLGKNDVNSPYGGIRLLSRAAHDDYLDDAREATRTVESVARAALAAGVPDLTFHADAAAFGAVADRVQGSRHGADGALIPGYGRTGFALWAIPLFENWKTRDLKAGAFGMDLDGTLGGLSLGGDQTFADGVLRAGLAFHVGGGDIRSRGDVNRTVNDATFWGFGAYAGWAPGAFSLSADAHYTRTNNDTRQDLPSGLDMGRLEGDIHASALSAGLRAEYVFATKHLDITPHLGARYTRLRTSPHDWSAGGLRVLEAEAITQDIWSFPVGLTFSRDFRKEDTWLRPLLDLTLIPYAGDRDAQSVARFTGVDAPVWTSTRMLDSVTYGGQIGVEAGDGAVSMGLRYGFQLGSHSARHGVFATFRYEF